MSGPKVVRVVTREEIEANCRRHIKDVEEAVDAFVRVAKRLDLDDASHRAGLQNRLDELESFFKAERWIEVQKRGPQTVAFLRSETERFRTEAVAAAVEVMSKRRRLVDSARSLIAAYENSDAAIPATLAQVIAGAMDVEQRALPDLQSLVDRAFRALLSSAEPGRPNAKQTQLADRLGKGEAGVTLSEWLAARPQSSSVEDSRLDALLAEISVSMNSMSAAALFQRAARIAEESSPSRRALLTDSLILDVVEQLKTRRTADEAMARLQDARAGLAAIASPATKTIEAALSAALAAEDTTNADELVAEARAIADRESHAIIAAARRKAILSGLATLGYEIRATMETAWARDGRLIVKKPGRSDYGVELGAPADASRLQLRLVGSELPSAPRTTSRDKDEEIIWCGEFERLRVLIAAQGGGVEIERAVATGVQAVKSAAFNLADERDRTLACAERTPLRK
jgi:hypothetical protein